VKNRKILFIVEQNLVDGRLYFGASNDLLLIFEALRMGLEIYLTTPQNISQKTNLDNFLALKLSENLDPKKVIAEIKNAWVQQVTNCLLALPTEAEAGEKARSKILFLDAKTQLISLKEILIFNRAEPISLTDKFYDILIDWQKNGIKICPDPYLNKILGDKLAIDAIHNNRQIAGINLLEGIKFADQENQISFESEIISISKNNLQASEIAQFYDLIIAKNFEKAQEIFSDEYQIFMQAARKYLAFHQQLNNDSIIKPASYFGGTGVVVAKNKTLNLNQAIENICQSFLAIKQDFQENNHPNLAFLPAIIVQKRATEAHLGDLRIMFCGQNLQGIFVRVNPNFEKSNANNLHFGGHPESLFKHYTINKNGVDLIIDDIKKSGLDDKNITIKKAQALYDLLKIIDFLKQIKILKQYPIIGIDALLTCGQNGEYKYAINEINLTSPMGQTQLLLLQMAVKFSDLATRILQENSFEINLDKYQILADYFQNKDSEITSNAKNILLQNQDLQGLIAQEAEKLLTDNFATQTLKNFINQ
jgi:hypothetical protein